MFSKHAMSRMFLLHIRMPFASSPCSLLTCTCHTVERDLDVSNKLSLMSRILWRACGVGCYRLGGARNGDATKERIIWR
jgi:hypothetical protein